MTTEEVFLPAVTLTVTDGVVTDVAVDWSDSWQTAIHGSQSIYEPESPNTLAACAALDSVSPRITRKIVSIIRRAARRV